VIVVRLILRLTLSLTVLCILLMAGTLAATQAIGPSAALAYEDHEVSPDYSPRLVVADVSRGTKVDLTGHQFVGVYVLGWSQDGQYLAFTGQRYGASDETLNVWDTHYHRFLSLLTVDQTTTSPHASWSPDGRSFALSGVATDGTWGIFVVGVDSRNSRLLTPPNLNNDPQWPIWSPRGDQIAFVANNASGLERDLWLIDPNGENLRRVGEVQTTISRAAWSPDGDWLAFPTAGGITIANVQDDELTYQVPALYITMQPAWSPDGQYLYYGELNEGGSLAVNRFDIATHTVTKLLSNPSPGTELQVSPDGRQIALAILCIPDLCIHVMNVDGSHHRVVAEIPQPHVNQTSLAWWP
jgi:Tol biopolymer transport system component